MDRIVLLQHLALAARHISEGAERLARQQELIDQLVQRRHDTRGAEVVLLTMRETQYLHIEDRNRIIAELAKLSG
jgi:hypothetical protein